jgi:hypothetical protein
MKGVNEVGLLVPERGNMERIVTQPLTDRTPTIIDPRLLQWL